MLENDLYYKLRIENVRKFFILNIDFIMNCVINYLFFILIYDNF